MRTFITMLATASLAAGLAVSAPATGTTIGNEGCTPGYWKNHTDNWLEDEFTMISPTRPIYAGGAFYVTAPLRGDTFLQALSYQGGPGKAGAERILLRAAAAAFLNAAHEGVGYPYRRYTDPLAIVPTVSDAIRSGDRERMLALATQLDTANNLGCPLN